MGKKRVIVKSEEGLSESKKDKISEGGVVINIKKDAIHKIKEGRVYIFSSYNNTIMTLTDEKGNTLTNISAGAVGFKGTKKSTPFAASKVAEILSEACHKLGVDKVQVYVKGIGAGRESAIRSLVARGVDIVSIKDMTPIPHNGCRPPKVRRV